MTAPRFIPGWEIEDAAGSFKAAWSLLNSRKRILRALKRRAGL